MKTGIIWNTLLEHHGIDTAVKGAWSLMSTKPCYLLKGRELLWAWFGYTCGSTCRYSDPFACRIFQDTHYYLYILSAGTKVGSYRADRPHVLLIARQSVNCVIHPEFLFMTRSYCLDILLSMKTQPVSMNSNYCEYTKLKTQHFISGNKMYSNFDHVLSI